MNLGALTAYLGVDVSGVYNAEIAMRQFEQRTATIINSTQARMNALHKTLQTTGRFLSTNLSLPMALAGGASFKMAKDFEKNMQMVNGLVGISQSQVDDWSKQILQMSPNLARPPKELAAALYFVTSSGIQVSEAMDVVTHSAKAATAGLGDTAANADYVTSAMNAYKNSGMTASRALDILTAAVREGKGEAAAYSQQIGDVIPIAAKLSVGLDEVAAGIAAVTLTGTNVPEAVTQIRGALNSLLDPSSQAEDALRAMGTSGAELRTELRDKGLFQTLKTLNDLTNKYGEDMMGKVFPNIRALTFVLSAMGDRMDENIALAQRVRNSNGDMNRSYQSAANNLDTRFSAAMANVQSAFIQYALSVKSLVVPAINAFGNTMKALIDTYNMFPEGLKKGIFYIGALATTIGPALLGLGALTKAFSAVGGVIPWVVKQFHALELAMLTNPWVAVTALAIGYIATLGILTSGTNEAAKAQSKYNDEIQRGQQLMGQFQSLEEKMSVISTITSKTQVENLKMMIDSQLAAAEDFNNQLLGKAKKALKEDEKLIELEKQYAQAKDEIGRTTLKTQIRWRQEEILAELELMNKGNQDKIKKLHEYQRLVEQKLKSFKPDAKGGVGIDIDAYKQVQNIMKDVSAGESYATAMTKLLGAEFDAASYKTNLYKGALENLYKYLPQNAREIQEMSKKYKELKGVADDVSTVIGGYLAQAIQTANEKMIAIKATTKQLTSDLDLVALQTNITAKSTVGLTRLERTYESLQGQASAYNNALQNLWSEGMRPGTPEMDKVIERLVEVNLQMSKMESVRNSVDSIANSFTALGGAIQGVAGNWLSWVGNLIGSIPTIIAGVKAMQSAEAGEAIAGATASGAKLPFPANIAAIFAGIAAVVAALATVPKMKEGGVVPPGYPNDTYPAFLTSGERIVPPGKLDVAPVSAQYAGGDFRIVGYDWVAFNRKWYRRMQRV